MRNLFGLGKAELLEGATALGEPAYRATQIYTWLHKRRARSFAEMTDLGKPLREGLRTAYALPSGRKWWSALSPTTGP